MDIVQLSMDMSQDRVLSAVGTSMLSKTMDLASSEMATLTEGINMNAPSLESLCYPTMGTQIDMRV